MTTPRCGGRHLNAFLIMPVQRIPRYKMLLGELLKYTPDAHPEHNAVQAVRERERERERARERGRGRGRERDRERPRGRERHRETQSEIERPRGRDRQSSSLLISSSLLDL